MHCHKETGCVSLVITGYGRRSHVHEYATGLQKER
jgi:hypothetical protein